MRKMCFLLLIACILGCSSEPEVTVQQMPQYPSPMADSIRAHERIPNKQVPGVRISLDKVLAKPVAIYIPETNQTPDRMDILIHFHGMSYVAESAVYKSSHPFILAVINLGSGSSVYGKAFREKSAFSNLIKSIVKSASKASSAEIEAGNIYLSSFSAGYGAVRAIVRDHQPQVDGVILLDGIHTGYVPSRQVLAEGGKLNEDNLKVFLEYARLAKAGKKKFLITHSAIFPGTYASTTETTDYIIRSLNLERKPVLKWGPMGMQLLSETNSNGLTILGFAGNSAPDHIDHFHGLGTFLKMMLED